jgi:hypothetical protein|tara:strand:+ start:366 stop:782 length:417 start_codon:yes stop_codon:yes gene_type:complete
MTYKFLDLPEVPEDLILPVEEVLQLENIFGGETKNYTIHECQDELREYLKELFPECEKFRYQTLIKGVPVHKDRGRTTAINYIIETGGNNVQTIWYEEDYTTPTHNVILPKKKWHELQVDLYHTVANIEERRFAITVC